MRAPGLAVLLTLCACSSSEMTKPCMGTVMGGLQGTFSVCNTYDSLYRQNTNTFIFDAAYTELPTAFTWITHWEIKGEPNAMAYNQDTRDIDCSVTMKKGAFIWLARKGAGVPASGTCSLSFADVASHGAMGNVTSYTLRGNVSAHLDAQPGTGSTGTVDVTVDFGG